MKINNSHEKKPLYQVYHIKSEDHKIDIENDKLIEKTPKFSFFVSKNDDRKFGNTIVLFFFKGEPLIVIGPHCNFQKNFKIILKNRVFISCNVDIGILFTIFHEPLYYKIFFAKRYIFYKFC